MVPLNQRFVKNVGNYSESAARDHPFLEQNRCYFFK